MSDLAEPSAAEKPAERGFVRGLGLFDSVMIVAGTMIGSGIFIVSADMSRDIGSPGGLLVAWAFAGFLTVAAALSYGELASMMPHAGGMYVYLREAFSPIWGFLYGWTLFGVIQTGTIAASTPSAGIHDGRADSGSPLSMSSDASGRLADATPRAVGRGQPASPCVRRRRPSIQ